MATAMVIGADRGIGAALVDVYKDRGDEVIAVCLGDGLKILESVDCYSEKATESGKR